MYPKATQIAQAAGDAIMAVYARDFETETKADNSPLTEADMAAHHLIVQQLGELTPDIPVLSEESTGITWAQRQQWQRYWLVDPLDGTKEFIKKNGEFTVNIALIENGEPVWGVVHAPAIGTTYAGGTAVGQTEKTDEHGTHTINATQPPEGRAGWRIMGSRSFQNDEFKAFVQQYERPEIKNMGSSLKICLVAEGEADLYPRFGPTSEWDTGAAHAVLLGAGGQLVDAETDQPLRYNQKESLLNPWFIAKGR